MRGLPILLVLLPLAIAPAAAHEAADCAPATPFPSGSVWALPPGMTLSYFLPANLFFMLVAAGPVDVTMYANPSCAPDESCHHHDFVGPLACSTHVFATVEIANRGELRAPVTFAVGRCVDAAICEEM